MKIKGKFANDFFFYFVFKYRIFIFFFYLFDNDTLGVLACDDCSACWRDQKRRRAKMKKINK